MIPFHLLPKNCTKKRPNCPKSCQKLSPRLAQIAKLTKNWKLNHLKKCPKATKTSIPWSYLPSCQKLFPRLAQIENLPKLAKNRKLNHLKNCPKSYHKKCPQKVPPKSTHKKHPQKAPQKIAKISIPWSYLMIVSYPIILLFHLHLQ